ncbi:hypothetical protein GCM10009112_12260 [Marinomonas arenicola]
MPNVNVVMVKLAVACKGLILNSLAIIGSNGCVTYTLANTIKEPNTNASVPRQNTPLPTSITHYPK